MGFSFDDPQKNIAYFLLIVVIGLIFIKTDKYYANPTLALFGYKLYRVNISHAGSGEVKNVIAISMDVLTVDDQVFYSFFDDYVFIARKKIMTPVNFKNQITEIFDNFSGIRIIFIVKTEDNYELKLSKIDAEALPKIVEGFKIRLYDDIVTNEDLTIPLLSNFDDRKKCLVCI